MQTFFIILTLAFYLLAGFMIYQQRSYRYLIVLALGHLTALFDPLWQRLFAYTWDGNLSTVAEVGRFPIPTFFFLMSSWFYALPALVLFYIYRRGWWPRHYFTGIVAYMSMLLYHLLIQGLLGRGDTPLRTFDKPNLPLTFPFELLVALLAALISLLLLYLLIATRHYPWTTLIPIVLGALLGTSLLVYGVLGAPFWLPQRLNQAPTVAGAGLLVTIGVVVWAAHLACWGLHATRQQRVRWS